MTSPTQEMKSYGLDAEQLLAEKKVKKPTTAFRSKMDNQVAGRIAADKEDATQKMKHGLSRYLAKFRGAGVVVFSLFLVGFLGFLHLGSQQDLPTGNQPIAKEISQPKFDSKIALQIQKKKSQTQEKPKLLSYVPRGQSVKFERVWER